MLTYVRDRANILSHLNNSRCTLPIHRKTVSHQLHQGGGRPEKIL